MKPRLLLLAGMVLLGACAAQQKESNVNLGGYPPAFRAGYLDGCASARRAAGAVRHEARFKADPMYATGWRDGFEICKKQKK
jgi:hypothetical protein